jgi:hypothetical protein
MTADAWHSVGFSGLPSNAAPAMQDQAAQRLYARYGTAPWPVCGKRYGGASSSGAASSGATSSPVTSSGATSSGVTSSNGYAAAVPSYRAPAQRVPSDSAARQVTVSGHHAPDPAGQASSWTARAPVLDIRMVGQTRPDVRLYQLALQRLGFRLAADGRFGPVTAMTTMHFQAGHGLLVDGRVGPQTRAAIVRAL